MENRDKFLWEKIRDDIRSDIIAGKRKPNDTLPSLRAIKIKYGVSMPVAQRAYNSLIYSGLAYAIEGKGTYVSPNPLTAEQKHLDQIVTSQDNFESINNEVAIGIADRLNMLYTKLLLSNNFGTLDLFAIKISASFFEQIADVMADGTDIKEFLSQNDNLKGNK